MWVLGRGSVIEHIKFIFLRKKYEYFENFHAIYYNLKENPNIWVSQ
jgi:hypothetical protein